MSCPCGSPSTRMLCHLLNILHSLSHFWHLVRGLRYDRTELKRSFASVPLELEDPRTGRDLHSVQDLIRLLVYNHPVGLNNLEFSLSGWFLHMFESEDHAIL